MAKKTKAKKDIVTPISSYEEDCVWMSYRYCIGRHTIAAHSHAEEIATNTYKRFLLKPNRMQFMSEDINSEIHQRLHFGNFIDMGWYGNIPKSHFRPLDVVYKIFHDENIDTAEKIKGIRTIDIDWDYKSQDFFYSIYQFNDAHKNRDYGRSLNDFQDLEVWQRLANLFDLKNHKWCRLSDDTLCEYYEGWISYGYGDKYEFVKKKIPVDCYGIGRITYLDEDKIVEDDVKLPEEDKPHAENEIRISEPVDKKFLKFKI